MKRFLVIAVSLMFLAVSCGGGESKKVVEEKTQTITAAEGGEIEVADGAAKIKIPAGALRQDTEISVKLYKTDGFNNKKALVSNVVEFGPSGIHFFEPVIITINAERSVSGKTIAAAVMKSDGTWSFSKEGAFVKFDGYDEAGDPIMTTAAGDPIMISDGSIMASPGDPIMNASAGDPIMVSAAGDPIMNAAAGDPIMMTTGHFSTYTFVVVDEVKEDKNSGGSSGKVTCKTAKEWDKLAGETTDYEDDDESIYCKKTGEEIVYCLSGVFSGADSKIYSIKVDGKEFKCESEDYADCVLEMEQYCGALDGEYNDGYYCEDQGICEKTGEMSKYCASTKGDGKNYFQAGEQKFECTNDNVEECYMNYHEYCGDTVYEEEEPEEPDFGLICRTESEWAEEFSDEEHHQWICETTGLEISICIPDTFDMESMEEGEFPPFYSIETGGGTILCDPSTADTGGTIGDYATSMDCYLEAEEYCTPMVF